MHTMSIGGDAASGALAAPILRALPASLLDEVETGFIVCGPDGVVLYANHGARQELACGLRLSLRHGRIASADDDALADALTAAQRGRRRLLVLRGDEQPLVVSCAPLADTGGAPLVLLTLGRRTLCSALALEMYASRTGLTPAERRVLAGLCAGQSPGELAADHGVALCTVRSQIKSLHDKLGVTSHGALVTLMATLPPLAGALRMAPPAPLRRAA